MPERRRTLRNILKVQGPLIIAVGIGWLLIPTRGRLSGVVWLEDLLSWIPGPSTVDTEIGLGWVICGLIMSLGGFLGSKLKALENAGFVSALCWFVGTSLVYFFAAATGYAPNGALNAISYLVFAAPYFGLMIRPPKNSVEPLVYPEVLKIREGGDRRES
jgi:hypothetical protein